MKPGLRCAQKSCNSFTHGVVTESALDREVVRTARAPRLRQLGGGLMLRHCFALALIAILVVPPASAAPVPDTRLGVAEGFRNPAVMNDIQAGWERLILPWDQIQPAGPDDFSHLGITI